MERRASRHAFLLLLRDLLELNIHVGTNVPVQGFDLAPTSDRPARSRIGTAVDDARLGVSQARNVPFGDGEIPLPSLGSNCSPLGPTVTASDLRLSGGTVARREFVGRLALALPKGESPAAIFLHNLLAPDFPKCFFPETALAEKL